VGAATGSPAPAADTLDRPLSDALDEYERALITRAMSAAGGNVAEAARRLQTDRPNLYRRMRRLGIDWGGAITPSGGSFAGNSLA
jgi:transcriptional regulator with GAF, ATPase, and Fis domain